MQRSLPGETGLSPPPPLPTLVHSARQSGLTGRLVVTDWGQRWPTGTPLRRERSVGAGATTCPGIPRGIPARVTVLSGPLAISYSFSQTEAGCQTEASALPAMGFCSWSPAVWPMGGGTPAPPQGDPDPCPPLTTREGFCSTGLFRSSGGGGWPGCGTGARGCSGSSEQGDQAVCGAATERHCAVWSRRSQG